MTEADAITTRTSTRRVGMPPAAGAERPVAVRLDSVTKRFSTQIALHPLDLAVSEGEFVTLLGPSGCGKTTLLRIVAGLEVPDDGTVSIFGADVTDRPANKRPVNLVFQKATLFPHLTVAENIAFGPRLRRMAKQQVSEKVLAALDLVRMPGFGDRHVTELSGGQAQRIALARALANDPQVLLLDEPLSALDLEIRRQLQAELKDIHRRLGLTFIYVTHDQEEAMSMSDRMAIMNHGRIDQVGTPGVVYEQPVNPFVGRFLGEANLIEGTVTAAHGDQVRLVLPDGEALHAARGNGYDTGPALLFIRPERVDILSRVPAETDPRFNTLAGRVRRCSFLGNILRYAVDVGGISPITIDLQNAVGVLPLAQGTAVTLRWPVADSLILPAGTPRVGTP
jgi:ABC-type Fe3+/spermidine/putrescine transport system ATPase subunit